VIVAADAPPTRRERPLLRGDEVRVEWLRIDAFRHGLVALREILSAGERERADAFHFAEDRETFTITRATLRTLLGRYLGLPPRQVPLAAGPYGKPILDLADDRDLRFNVSHAGGVSALALTRGRRVGLDVEQLRPGFPVREVAGRVFSERERAELDAVAAEQQLEAFFQGWTRKEAYLKAVGTGFFAPLEAFSVSLTPGLPARLLEVVGDPRETSRWCLESWSPERGYVAAVAAEGDDWLLVHRQLIPDPRDPTRLQ
jgi:4'-phosphopantetheinyl transferase